jgi:hypothetical protein
VPNISVEYIFVSVMLKIKQFPKHHFKRTELMVRDQKYNHNVEGCLRVKA